MKKKLLRFLLSLLSVLLALAVLVLVPLKTHRTPEKEIRYTEPPTETPVPTLTVTPEPVRIEQPDPRLPNQDGEMQALIDDFVAQHPGDWTIYFFNLSHGQIASAAAEAPIPAESLIKLFIMLSAYQCFEEESLSYWNCYGTVQRMITGSDDFYANYLITHIGGGSDENGLAYVTEFAHTIGCENTVLSRRLDDSGSEAENYSSAEDLAQVFLLLYRCELFSPDYSAAMLDMLKTQSVNDRIPAGLPEGTVCAHRAGDPDDSSVGDAALVFSPGADYILTVINSAPEDTEQAKEDIAALSRLIYAVLNPETAETPETGPSEP